MGRGGTGENRDGERSGMGRGGLVSSGTGRGQGWEGEGRGQVRDGKGRDW